jgi:hypothetical protein
MFLSDEKVPDITVEDPNDSFQDMRDRHDVSFLLDCGYLASFSMDKAVKLSVNDANVKYKFCQVFLFSYSVKPPVSRR